MTQSQAYFSKVCFLKQWSSQTCLESFRERADQFSCKYPQGPFILFIWCWSLITLYFSGTFEIKTASTAKACDHWEQPNAQARSGDKQASPSRQNFATSWALWVPAIAFQQARLESWQSSGLPEILFCHTAWCLLGELTCQFFIILEYANTSKTDFHKQDVGRQCLASQKVPANP